MAAAMGGHEGGKRGEVQRLRDEFVSLNAERMRYMAAFEQTKRSNEDSISSLREENKALKERLARLQSDVAAAHSVALSEAEEERLTGEVTLWRSKHDSCRHSVAKQSKEYSRLREELMALHRQRSTAVDTPEMRAVRALENRLDKAMLKYNEAQSIRKTYEQIVKRLREERMSFDHQLSALEATLTAKRSDLKELRGLATEAEKAKTAAIDGMKRVALQQKTEAEKRIKALRAKEEAALKQARASRTQRRRRAAAAGQRDLTAAEEEALRQEVVANLAEIEDMASAEAASLSKVHLYEEAFRAIQEVTGVRDENEVIQRLGSQVEQLAALQALSADNAARIAHLHEELAARREGVEQVKFGGAGARVGGKQAQGELELQVGEASSRKAKASSKFAHLAGVLNNLKAGIEHLADTLAPAVAELGVALPPTATAYRDTDKRRGRASVPIEDDTGMVDTLQGVETATVSVLGHVESITGQLGGGEIDPATLTGFGSADSAGRPASASSRQDSQAGAQASRGARLDGSIDEFLAASLTDRDIDAVNGRGLNMRLKVPSTIGSDSDEGLESRGPGADAASSDSEGDDGAPVSRAALKRQAHRSAAAAARKAK